ncbi:MAG: TlpA disulfide reductase family protein [Pseudomonadota bacterium]
MLRIFSASILALGFAACAHAEDNSDPGGDAATDYYRPGHVIPASADLSRGDVPRDAYGRPYTYEGLGAPLPIFDGTKTDGTAFSSLDLEGRWTVIEVWGIWCHDSRNDAPFAAALSTALGQDPDVDFMSIHTPPNLEHADRALRGYDSVDAWFDEKGWSFPTVMDEDASVRAALNIRWTPTYLVVAPDRSVQGFRTGLADAGDLAVKDFVQDISETRRDWTGS